MKTFLDKLKKVETAIAEDGRPFDLFAIFSSEEGEEGAWDIVVSALWMNESRGKALEYLNEKVKEALTEEEFKLINTIQILDVYDPRVKDIQELINVEHDEVEINEYKFYGFIVDKVYIITARLQVETELLNLVWQIITELWDSGEKKIESETILSKLQAQGITVQDYALDRVLDYLYSSKIIRGARYVNSEAIRAHGAMIITEVNTNWSPGKPVEQIFEEQKTWWLYHSINRFTWTRKSGPYSGSEAKTLAHEQEEAAEKDANSGGLGWLFIIVNYDQGIEAPEVMTGTVEDIINQTASRI